MKSFKSFLEEAENGGYVYSLPEIKKKYDEYNKKLFGGKLPPVKMAFNRRGKSSVALVKSTPVKEGNRVTDVIPHTMEFSTQYNISPEQFEGLLVHEMIHVATVKDEFVYGNSRDGGHGRFFRSELDRVRKMVPFDVPEKEDDYKFAKSAAPKTSYVVIKDNGNKKAIAFISKKAYDGDDAIRAAQWWKEREPSADYLIGTTTSEAAKEYKTYRTLWKGNTMKMGFYSISDENYEDVMRKFTEKVKY